MSRLRRAAAAALLSGVGALCLAAPGASGSAVNGSVTTISSAVNFPASSLSSSENGTELFVTDQFAQEIFRLDAATGALTAFASAPGISNLRLVVDPSGDVIYASDGGLQVVSAISCAGNCPYGLGSMTPGETYTIVGGASGSMPARPNGVGATSINFSGIPLTTDARGDLFFANESLPNTDIFMLAGTTCSSGCPFGLDTVAGDLYWVAGNDYTGSIGEGNVGDGGPATAALLALPRGAAIDSEGDLLIADAGANAVRLVAAYDCSSNCAFGLSNLTAGDIYTLAGSGTSDSTTPQVIEAYVPTSVNLGGADTLGFDARGDLLIGSSQSTVLNLLAASNCASACPYGLGSMALGKLYPLEGFLPLRPPSPTDELESNVAIDSVAGASLDHLGDEFLAAGSSVYRVDPTTPSTAPPEKLVGEPVLADHGARLAARVSCAATAAACRGRLELRDESRVRVRDGSTTTAKIEYHDLGFVNFDVRARHTDKTLIPLEVLGVRYFKKGASNVIFSIIDQTSASWTATVHVRR